MKHICIPLFFIRHKKVGGVENAIYNLVRGMASSGVRLTLIHSDEQQLDPEFASYCHESSGIELQIRSVLSKSLTRIIPDRYVRFVEEMKIAEESDKFDAVIFPNYFCPPNRGTTRSKFICIVQDLQHRHLPENFPILKKIWLELALRISFRYAHNVVFISSSTLQDARIEYPQFSSSKWVAIPCAVTWDDYGLPDEHSPYPFQYILSVANHFPHKNIETIVRAFYTIADRAPSCHLVLTGQTREAFIRSSTGKTVGLDTLIDELGLTGRVHVTGYVPRQRLGTLYKHAKGFVFPSLFEGFGLPPVEALGFGVRCVVSGIPSLSEVTLGLADSVQHPASIEEWSSALSKLLTYPPDRGWSRRAADEVKNTYSPESIAGKYLRLVDLP
jgi:glycosyltransferase involved in cell wall biosynthesis